MIKTDRLCLRRWRHTDADALSVILGDPDVMRFSDAGTLAASAQTEWLVDAVASSVLPVPLGSFAIALQGQDTAIGYVQLMQRAQRTNDGQAELGFRLARHVWGNGYATEACRAILANAGQLRDLKQIIAIVDPGNVGSVNVIGKLGMRDMQEVRFPGYDHPDHLYAVNLHDVTPE
ncbi:MAG: GNAT family N-acetyltransferase [Pseudomonadota bacterium]